MLKPTSDILKTGDAAPQFELPTADRDIVRLSDFRGRSLALIFIRGTW
jgi:peroxiredoxin